MPRLLTTNDLVSSTVVLPDQIGVANGLATLDATGHVPLAQLPSIVSGTVSSVNGLEGIVNLTASSVGALAVADVGVANGAASLDGTGHVPSGQFPLGFVNSGTIGAPSGIAGLDGAAHVVMSQLLTNAAGGLPQLDGSGVVQSAQSLIRSVNGYEGAVVLAATDVNAVPDSAIGTANGVASLNTSSKVPLSQLPDLSSLYVPVPTATATAAGQLYTSTGPGSNSAQWSSPLAYTATSSAGRPVAPPTGSLVTQTDTFDTFIYNGSQWFQSNVDISVPRFSSDAAVAAYFPTPPNGQLIMRTDVGIAGTMMRYSTASSRWVADDGLISEQILPSAAATVTFSSIPQYWNHIDIMWRGHTDASSNLEMLAQVSGLTGAVYDWQTNSFSGSSSGTGASLGTQQVAAYNWFRVAAGVNAATYAFSAASSGRISFFEYSNPAFGASMYYENVYGDNTSMGSADGGGVCHTAGAVTSVKLYLSGPGNFYAGSTFRLYGRS